MAQRTATFVAKRGLWIDLRSGENQEAQRNPKAHIDDDLSPTITRSLFPARIPSLTENDHLFPRITPGRHWPVADHRNRGSLFL